jgi:hypothetical protein
VFFNGRAGVTLTITCITHYFSEPRRLGRYM